MSSTSACRARRFCLALLSALFLLFLVHPALAVELDPPQETEIWLVTYGPGEIYWQRFGHNAIWVRDSRLGLDHTFNFGFFDFQQERFFLRFLMGRMLYFSAAQEAQKEFAQYEKENRSIRAQRLAMTPEQQDGLIRFLVEEIRPENRDYLYDYYRNNCSTRVRDAIDSALGGAIRSNSEPLPAGENWRDHTRRLTQMDSWVYLGLESVLGRRVDRPISRWDELFIPGVLADEVASIESLVIEDRILLESPLAPPPAAPHTVWPRYLLASVFMLGLGWLLSRWLPATVLSTAWFTVLGIAGCGIVFLWFGTDHDVAALNLNVLVFNPLWLLFLFSRTARASSVLAVNLFSVLALAAAVSPVQYMADVVAAFVPVSLVAARVIQRAA